MIESVIVHYPKDCRPDTIQCLGNAGGFSGAQLWKLQTRRGELCLRQWPSEHPSPKRLSYIHFVLMSVAEQGIEFVPTPIATMGRSRFVTHDNGLWELTRWMPGRALLAPSELKNASDAVTIEKRVAAALRCLAQFHVAAAMQPADEPFSNGLTSIGRSTSLRGRFDTAERLINSGFAELKSRINVRGGDRFRSRIAMILQIAEPLVRRLPDILRSQLETRFNLQPCIRDVRGEHVLFCENTVTGIVDFGAMQEETVAGDVARLLSGVEVYSENAWTIGLAAYEQVRKLSAEERHATDVFRRSTIALSGLNWVSWLLPGGIEFENLDLVEQRLDEIIVSLTREAGNFRI